MGKTLAALLLLGFPFACLFAWAFEMTPEGVKKTAEVDRSTSITHSTGRKLDFVIIGALVVALGYFVWERQELGEPSVEVALDKSIAVLPFVNLSSDEEHEWFADGLTEEILNSLARTPDLLVASRTSSFQYKGQNTNVSEIAAALGVAHILEGSVRRSGNRLRVTAQLIRAHDGFHLWNALKTAMDPEALRKMVSSRTASVAAYEAYLEALALADILRGSEFPAENIKLVLLRQACAEGDQTAAQQYYEEVVAIERPDPSIDWLGLQIMGKPEAAHRLLVDADMDKYTPAKQIRAELSEYQTDGVTLTTYLLKYVSYYITYLITYV